MLRRIAVHLDTDDHCSRRIDIATALAKRHGASLVGVFASFQHPQSAYEAFLVPATINAIGAEGPVAEQLEVMTRFHSAAEREGVTSHFRFGKGMPEDVLAFEARFCDAVIVSQPDLEFQPVLLPGLMASVILAAGRPVLMLPSTDSAESLGNRVLYCWDGGRESARALADAAPFLQDAKELFVLVVDVDKHLQCASNQHREDLTDYCLQHRFPLPQIVERSSTNLAIGDVILNAAADIGCDLIVMGAYGHSRLRQAILGGTTRNLVETMTVSVLFSH